MSPHLCPAQRSLKASGKALCVNLTLRAWHRSRPGRASSPRLIAVISAQF